MELAVGTIISGKVTTITKFGAFVALPEGKSGLVHISEVANTYVNDVHDFLTEGQEVQVKLLAVTPDGKLNLSVKQAQPRQVREPRETQERHHTAYRPGPQRSRDGRTMHRPLEAALPPQEPSFEDKLKQFMSASDSKMSELNRNREGKRRRRK